MGVSAHELRMKIQSMHLVKSGEGVCRASAGLFLQGGLKSSANSSDLGVNSAGLIQTWVVSLNALGFGHQLLLQNITSLPICLSRNCPICKSSKANNQNYFKICKPQNSARFNLLHRCKQLKKRDLLKKSLCLEKPPQASKFKVFK